MKPEVTRTKQIHLFQDMFYFMVYKITLNIISIFLPHLQEQFQHISTPLLIAAPNPCVIPNRAFEQMIIHAIQ